MASPELHRLPLEGVIEIVPKRFGDSRGWFAETWRDGWLEAAGIDIRFVQDNASFSAARGTVRGLHFQLEPAAQAKLVRVVRGSIFDVAVDVRKGSPNFGQWAGSTLSAEAGNCMFVPGGFAHGFMTVEDNTEVAYKVSAPYDPALERSVRFDDPAIGIDWPAVGVASTLSPKDEAAPLLSEIVHEL